MKKVLILEDEVSIRSFVVINLRRAGYEAIEAGTGMEALEKLKENPDVGVAILDIMLPDIDGFEVCRNIRATNKVIGIIMLTARTQEMDKVTGLMTGADDYVTKPFSREVLLARIRAVLRRQDALAAGRSLDGLALNEADFAARLNDETLSLTRTEFRILSLLASRPGRVYTRQQIIDATQSEEKAVTERTVDVQIVGLRRKLGDWATAHIETIRGVGYRVKP